MKRSEHTEKTCEKFYKVSRSEWNNRPGLIISERRRKL